MRKMGSEQVDIAIANLTPRALANEAARRVQRAVQRETGKAEAAKALLAIERRNGVSARSWKAAILARVIAESE